MFDHAKTTLATRIDQLDKGTVPKDANWGMEAVVAGSMYKGISVEKRVETLYNLSVQKGQLTSTQQKELGDIYDLTSSNFIVHASTMGSMSMEKAEFQKGLERTAEGQTYLGYALINAAVGKMTQNNLDAGVGVSTWDDPANSRFKIESKGIHLNSHKIIVESIDKPCTIKYIDFILRNLLLAVILYDNYINILS